MYARRGGFTIIELMVVVVVVVVVVVIAILAAIAVPNLVSARVTANETSALATLRTMATAEAQLRSVSLIDVDGDGTGEYGYFRELSGAVGVRTSADGSSTGSLVEPSILSGAFRSITAAGTVTRSGYTFRVTLAATGGLGVEETASGAFTGGSVDSDIAETIWSARAWPTNFQMTGNRSYFVNQRGDILAAEDPTYTGPSPGFLAGSAFQLPGNVASITGTLAIGTFGRNGNLWKRVN